MKNVKVDKDTKIQDETLTHSKKDQKSKIVMLKNVRKKERNESEKKSQVGNIPIFIDRTVNCNGLSSI